MRPADLPPADSWPHGVRARYVSGCRCNACRAANTAYARQRAATALRVVAELDVQQDAGELARGKRTYRRACPGLPRRRGCTFGSYLRRDSKGGLCAACRQEAAADRVVSAARARRHLAALSRQGIGRRAVAAASDVGETAISEITRGAKRQIRSSTERALLEVTADALADHATIDAADTWALVSELLEAGWSKAELARRLGYERPALQLGSERVLARTALRVRRLHRELSGTTPAPVICRCPEPIELERRDRTLCARCEGEVTAS